MKGTTIRQRLMRVILFTSVSVITIACAAYFTYEFLTFRQAMVRQLKATAEIIATNSTAALAFQNTEDASHVLNSLKADKHIVAACLFDQEGHVFSFYPGNMDTTSLELPGTIEGYHFKGRFLTGMQPVTEGSTRWGTLLIRSDMVAVYDKLKVYGVIVCLIILLSYLLASLLSLRLRGTILKPIFSLVQTSGQISANADYSIRAKKYRDDELGSLTDSFNHMLAKIEVQNEEITSFNHGLEQKVIERTTELEKSNAVLKEQKEFVETILDSSVDSIAVFNNQLEYVVINKYAESIYNLRSNEVIGRRILDLFPGIQQSGMYQDLLRTLQGETVHNPKYKSAVLGRYFENFYVPLKDPEDKVYGVLVVGHDITEIVSANEQLQIVNTKLVKSNQELEQFAYIASHDLQEPLRKIQLFSQLAHTNQHDPVAAQQYLDKINKSAGRMSDLIKAVLNYSRLSQNKNAFVDVDLNATLRNTLTDLEIIIAEKNAVTRYGNLPVVRGVEVQLEQLFLNLLSNSLKFSAEQPVITITAETITAERLSTLLEKDGTNEEAVDQGTNYTALQFTDNGIGFEPQYAAQVFTIFKRLHSGQQYPGTGIGLSLVKKIVENHHGFITVTSSPGQGSSFNIYLPVILNHLQ